MAMLGGRFGEAARIHPLVFVVVPVMGGFLAWAAAVYVRQGRWPGGTSPAAERIAVGGLVLWVLLIGVWIARFYGAFGGPAPV
jgi:hypothetical protein